MTDPLTECPYCAGAGYACCGRYEGGQHPDEPPSCCGDPDVCAWCDQNDKSWMGQVPPDPKPFESGDGLPF